MYVNLAFSAEAFKKLIKYRITDQFRPLIIPIDYPEGERSWLDGLIVFDPVFTRLTEAPIVLNEASATDPLRPNVTGYSYAATAVAIDVPMTIFYAKIQDVANAGLADPPVGQIPVPIGAVRIILRSVIADDGLPHIQMQLDTARLSSLPVPPEVIASLSGAAALDAEFDLANTLGDLFPPQNRRILNTAITLDGSNNILMRFEFTSRITRSIVSRWHEWQGFVQKPPLARLEDSDWCIDIEGAAMATGTAQMVDPLIDDKPPVYFSSGIDWSFGNGRPPKIIVKKAGRIENACAGNDIRFDAIINIDISVPPQGNIIRGVVSFDLDKNDWDVAKCFAVTILNPLSVLITLFDQGEAGYGAVFNFVLPRPIIVFGGLILLMLGFDETMAQNMINEQLAEEPSVQKLPDGNYALEQDMALNNPITMNWMQLTEAVGEDGRMLMRGALRVPDPILPKLKAEDLVGFSAWHLVNRCEPSRGQSTNASLNLFLRGGYGGDSEQAKPTIPLRYGDRTYEIINDRLGIYQDLNSQYTQVYFPGIPGTVQCTLRSDTLSKPAFVNFDPPYPLRIRFYTNGGVREYEFTAPPVYKRYQESNLQIAERINKCKQLMNERFFSIKWLVDPPPYERVGQRWQLHVRGLKQGTKAQVFNQETGTALGEFVANEFHRLDISVALPPDQYAASLLVALDDMPFLNAYEMAELRRKSDNNVTDVEVAVRQTNLFKVDEISFREPVRDVSLELVEGLLMAKAKTLSGKDLRTIVQQTGTMLSDHKNLAFTRMKTTRLERANTINYIAETEAEKGEQTKKADGPVLVDDILFLPDQDKKQYTLYREGPPLMTGATAWEE